jgi:hypothetical protein
MLGGRIGKQVTISMNNRFSVGLGIVAVLAIAAWAPPTRALEASNKEAVRQLSNEAYGDFEAGRYQQALEKFQRAYDSAKVPTLLVLIGRTQVKLGHWVEAYEAYHQAIILDHNDLWIGSIQQEAQQNARRELDALLPRVPRLTIRIEGAQPKDVAVRIDDVDIPSSLLGVERLSDPGRRRIVGHLGAAEAHSDIVLSEGERKEVVLKFPQSGARTPKALPSAPTTPKSSSGARAWGWASIGVGATGLALGTVTGIVLVAKHGSLTSNCNNHQCEPEHWSEASTFNTLRYTSAIGFIVGGIGTAAGITLLATHPKQESKPNISFYVAPTSAGAQGTF